MKEGRHAFPLRKTLFEFKHLVFKRTDLFRYKNKLCVTVKLIRLDVKLTSRELAYFLNTLRRKSDATSSFEARRDDWNDFISDSVELANLTFKSVSLVEFHITMVNSKALTSISIEIILI